ncbi:hypothetical protein [Arsenophonus endosymbiont of Aleurodicus floccissimus]|nr:hypothetical protein [Arsenophonus endosymbiont of Aleurodicus floccissimus]
MKMESAQKNIEAKLKTQRNKFITMDKAISEMKQSSNSLVALLTK